MTIATISGTVTSQVDPGVGNYASVLTITHTGEIDGGTAGSGLLANDPAGPVSVENDGVIRVSGTLYSAAVLNGGAILLRNDGTVDGNDSVFVGVGASLVNTGLVTYSGTPGKGYGVVFENGSLLDNSGTISNVVGISSVYGGTIINSGTVYGSQTGVQMGAARFYNSGIVAGGQTGLLIRYAGAEVVDSGTIEGGLVDRYAGLGLTLLPGAAVYGTVRNDVGGGTLELAGSVVGTVNLEGFSGFSEIGMAAGAQWVVDGFTATAAYYAAGGGLTLSNDAAATTLFLNGLGPVTYAANTGSSDGMTLDAAALVRNTGTITGEVYGLGLGAGGTVVNTGTIVAAGLYQGHGGASYSSAGIYGGVAVTSAAALTLANYGSIAGAAYGVLLQAGGSILNAGTIAGTGDEVTKTTYIALPPSNSVTHYFTPGIALENTSAALSLTADPGAVFLGAVIDLPGSGALTLGSGTAAGTLDIASFNGFSSIDFAADAVWTLEGGAGQLAQGQVITGFSAGDTILLDGFAATTFGYYSGLGLVLNNGTSFPMLRIEGDFSQASFDVSSDGGSTTIAAACFCRGTRIGTPEGEVPVEDLGIGDEILTMHAGVKRIKWIGRRSYAAPFADGDFVRPIRLRPGALGDDMPRRELHVSPGHAVFAGGALVPAWRLLNGASVAQLAHVELVEYFHIELDSQEVIFAESCPVESFTGAALRGQFQNVAEFAMLYPDDEEQAPCLTLLEDGFALEAVKAQVAARAGLPPALPVAPAALRGFVDVAGPAWVEGWVQDEASPETPVVLDVLRGGWRCGRVLANRYRADLRAAGLGSGCHAFRFALPAGEGEISVLRSADGAILPLTEDAARVA